ncbi:hypothetical protein RJ641_034121, partial [Dillenia turbinata]
THNGFSTHRKGVSSVEFDNKGIFLASVTKSGCLTVHKTISQMWTNDKLDVVRWNLANQDEVLRKRPALFVNGYGCDVRKGLYDIAFTSIDESRILASDVYSAINVWDRRTSDLPCLELSTDLQSILNSIELSVDNQLVFGAGKNGIIYIWDLHEGRSQVAFQRPREVFHPPLESLRLASMLQQIRSLKEQAHIVPKEVHSIDLDPSCPYQLAFHLDDGWSGVLDIHILRVTHIHCPPAWLYHLAIYFLWTPYQQHPVAINMLIDDSVFGNDSRASASTSCLRRPSWLPKYSIYAVGSTTEDGIHLLDFNPDSSSACHVDYSEEKQGSGKSKQNRFVSSCEGVTVCATHPVNGTLIAGTKESSLLVMSQWSHSS